MKNIILFILATSIAVLLLMYRNKPSNEAYNRLKMQNDSLVSIMNNHALNALNYEDSANIHINKLTLLNKEILKNENRDINSYLVTDADSAISLFIERAESYYNK